MTAPVHYERIDDPRISKTIDESGKVIGWRNLRWDDPTPDNIINDTWEVVNPYKHIVPKSLKKKSGNESLKQALLANGMSEAAANVASGFSDG